MVAFYKHDIPAWMDGTEALSDGAYRTYHVIVQLIMLNEGPIALNERGIAGRCNQALKTFKRNLDELLVAGKLQVIDGRLSNARAAIELEGIDANRRNAALGGRKSGKTRRNLPEISADVSQNSADPSVGRANSLELNETGLAPLHNNRSLKEKRRLNTPIVPKGTQQDRFAEFQAAYPQRISAFPPAPARKRWDQALRRGVDPAEIIDGAKAYAAEQQRIGKVGTEFVKSADAWLNQERWKDFSASSAPKPPPAAEVADETWRDRVRSWRARGGYWPWRPSEPPDDPRTAVPLHILDEFGIHHGKAARPLTLVAGTG